MAISNIEQGAAFFEGFANVINALRSCPKITIGRVQGKAVGGGVGLAAATDYCMGTHYSEIKLSELTIGIGPFVIEPAVARKMGACDENITVEMPGGEIGLLIDDEFNVQMTGPATHVAKMNLDLECLQDH